MLNCERCQKFIPTVEEAHSMVIVLQKVFTDGYSYYQCNSGAEYGGLTYQHFHCCREEMIAGVRSCINEHYSDNTLIPISPTQVQLHKTVLRAGINCKLCKSPITIQAYRFCLTHATPGSSVPDDSQNELGEWCCSLEHARVSVLRIIDHVSVS